MAKREPLTFWQWHFSKTKRFTIILFTGYALGPCCLWLLLSGVAATSGGNLVARAQMSLILWVILLGILYSQFRKERQMTPAKLSQGDKIRFKSIPDDLDADQIVHPIEPVTNGTPLTQQKIFSYLVTCGDHFAVYDSAEVGGKELHLQLRVQDRLQTYVVPVPVDDSWDVSRYA